MEDGESYPIDNQSFFILVCMFFYFKKFLKKLDWKISTQFFYIMVVNSTNFDKEVIQFSFEKPVLVDFWAEWCGPCKILSPVLEKLEKLYNGSWKLVKINTDQEPQLAMQYRVSGIPHCILFYQGKVIDSFTGALPEKMIRNFLDKNIPSEEKEQVKKKLQSGDKEQIKEGILNALNLPSVDHEIVKHILKNLILFIKEKDLNTIQKILNFLLPYKSELSGLIDYIKKYKHEESFWYDLEKLFLINEEGIQANILEEILKSFQTTKDEKYKQMLILSFQIIGQAHPLSNEYRKKLSSLIF